MCDLRSTAHRTSGISVFLMSGSVHSVRVAARTVLPVCSTDGSSCRIQRTHSPVRFNVASLFYSLMSVIAEIQLAGDFALSELLRGLPDVRMQLERVIPAGDRTIPWFGFMLMILSQPNRNFASIGWSSRSHGLRRSKIELSTESTGQKNRIASLQRSGPSELHFSTQLVSASHGSSNSGSRRTTPSRNSTLTATKQTFHSRSIVSTDPVISSHPLAMG